LSFYQKVESGVVSDIRALEDFVAAMIVVPLPSDIPAAIEFVSGFFEISYRRPESDSESKRPAYEFVFDDIRLYGKLRTDQALPPGPINEVVFEIQVKTFFQHAWSSATHDLVYKNSRFSWSRSRLAAQLRAVLENAELSMVAIDSLEEIAPIAKSGWPESEQNAILDVLRANWDDSILPDNLRRTAQTIHALLREFDVRPIQLSEMLARGKEDLRGHPDGWSPYQVIADYFSRYYPEKSSKVFRSKRRRLRTLHLTPEILARLSLSTEECFNCTID